MEPADFAFLISDAGHRWLRTVDLTAHDHLWWASELRSHLNAGQVHAVLETVLLRQRAASKFERAAELFFTRDGLEQATGDQLAAYRAKKIRAVIGAGRIADLGCGIGGDAMALAVGGPVVGLDRDFIRLRMAQVNHHRLGLGARFMPLQCDLTQFPPLPVDALFFDPARRDSAGRRFFSTADYQPSLQILERWKSETAHHAVKISPGIDYRELPPVSVAEAEFIAVDGGLKECVLWYGGLKSEAARRATILPGEHTLIQKRGAAEVELPVGRPANYLLEPDPAVIRAHLVGNLGKQLGGWLISPDIAYLTFDQPVNTPLGTLFAIDSWFPFQLKRLKKYVREHNLGVVEVKKRGSPIDPNEMARMLRGRGDQAATVFLTRVQGEPAVLVGRRI